jgi:KaiC/GvpD/RAD55 family RecA-like ATPase
MADGIILMESHYNGDGTLERHTRVLKMRGTEHTLKTHKYTIDKESVIRLTL